MTRFHCSRYYVGTTAPPEHRTFTLKQIQDMHPPAPRDSPVPPYAILWALQPHAPGDSLLAIDTNPTEDPCSVIRYQIIAE